MALDNTTLNKTTALNPALVERKKTRQEKAEDVIYTLNHSITCLGITDAFALGAAGNFINSTFGTKLKMDHEHNNGYGPFEWVWDRIRGKHKDANYVKEIHAKEDRRIDDHHREHGTGPYEHAGHDHHHEHHHEHDHAHDHHHHHKPGEILPDPAHKLTPDSSGKDALKKFGNNSKKWLLAEAVGDVGAVPFTIMLQRHAPNFMNWVRKSIVEPTVGGTFRKNTHRAAVVWGNNHGYGKDSQEVKDYGNKLYEYEMRHMPQMAVWTVSSVALNFGAMHAFHKMNPRQFERTGVKEFAMVKGVGAAMTAGIVLVVRGLTPGGAHAWDQGVGKHVIVPITKKVGGLFGVKAEDVDSFQKKRADIMHGEVKPANEVTEKKALNGRIQEQPELAAQV